MGLNAIIKSGSYYQNTAPMGLLKSGNNFLKEKLPVCF